MQPSRHLLPVGVGVIVALGNIATAVAEPASNRAPESAVAPQPTANDSASQTAIASPEHSVAPDGLNRPLPQRVFPAKAPLPRSLSQQPAGKPTAPKPATDAGMPAGASPTPSATAPQPEDIPYKPEGPAKAGTAPAYLNPSPNPLLSPTKPEEVKLQGIQPITLQQAVELAKRNNLTLQAALKRLDLSRAQLREAQAASFPTLSTQLNVSQSQSAAGELNQRGQGGVFSLFQNQNQDRSSGALNGTVTLSYDVYTSGQRPAQIRAAEKTVKINELSVESALEQLRQDVAVAYYNLQAEDESVRIAQAAVRDRRISLRDTQSLEKAGLGTRFDVLRAQVQLSNAIQDLTSARSRQLTRRRQLAQQLNLSNNVDLAAADPVQIAGNWNLSLEQSIVLAFKNRAELEQSLLQREQNDQLRRAALAGLGPRLTLSAQYQYQDEFDDAFGVADGYNLSATVNWNLFDGGGAKARAAQAEANIALAETTFADNRNQIRLAVETQYFLLRSSFENIATTRAAVEQAREALRLARLRFQAGVGTQADVINSETDLTNTEGRLVNAIIGYNQALVSLQRAISNLAIATGTATPAATLSAPTGTVTPTP